MQAVLRAVPAGSTLAFDQFRNVSWDFDLRPALEAAHMGGDEFLPIKDAHGI